MRTHYNFDRQRFLAPGDHAEEGYAWFLGEQLKDDVNAVVMVAEVSGEIIGYAYAELEPISWKELRDACGFIHDIVVDDRERRHGIATKLLEAAMTWLKDHGAPRVVLQTAEQNVPAQRLFAKTGFRRTMIEMTKEL
jgi:GNAT superfamily N-acetyltransferase